jgi:hypothetical protein
MKPNDLANSNSIYAPTLATNVADSQHLTSATLAPAPGSATGIVDLEHEINSWLTPATATTPQEAVNAWIKQLHTLDQQQQLAIVSASLTEQFEQTQQQLANKSLSSEQITQLKYYSDLLEQDLAWLNRPTGAAPIAEPITSHNKKSQDDDNLPIVVAQPVALPPVQFNNYKWVAPTSTTQVNFSSRKTWQPTPAVHRLNTILDRVDIPSKALIVSYVFSQVSDNKVELTSPEGKSSTAKASNVTDKSSEDQSGLTTIASELFNFFQANSQVSEQVDLFQAFALWSAQQTADATQEATATSNQITREFAQAASTLFNFLAQQLAEFNHSQATLLTPEQLAANAPTLTTNHDVTSGSLSQQDFISFVLEGPATQSTETTAKAATPAITPAAPKVNLAPSTPAKHDNQQRPVGSVTEQQPLINPLAAQTIPDRNLLQAILQFAPNDIGASANGLSLVINHQVLLSLLSADSLTSESTEEADSEHDSESVHSNWLSLKPRKAKRQLSNY